MPESDVSLLIFVSLPFHYQEYSIKKVLYISTILPFDLQQLMTFEAKAHQRLQNSWLRSLALVDQSKKETIIRFIETFCLNSVLVLYVEYK